jgi:hypothetical protein
MAKKKSASKVASVAAAAAAAAVKASQQEAVDLAWASDEDEEDGDDKELRDEIIAGLERIDEEAGGEIVWELYCDAPIGKKGQIRKLSTHELRGLRDECLGYGPGEYHVQARRKDGLFVKDSRRPIKISDFARPTAVMPSAAPPTDPMALIQQMEDRLERRRLEARREREGQIKFWAPILAPIGVELARGLFGNRGGESIKDLVGALVGMKDLMGKPENQVDTLLKGIELARDLNPADTKGSTWPDVLVNGITTVTKELRPLAEAAMNRRPGTNGAAPAAAPAQPAQLQFAPAPAAPGTTPPATGEEDPMWAVIKPLLQRLAGELEEYAVNGADPSLAAEALLAKIPRLIRNQVQPGQLKEWLMQPTWWAIATQFHPALGSYQGFCDDVRLALLDIVEEQLNPTPEGGDGEESASE